jgi:hypothetical protein
MIMMIMMMMMMMCAFSGRGRSTGVQASAWPRATLPQVAITRVGGPPLKTFWIPWQLGQLHLVQWSSNWWIFRCSFHLRTRPPRRIHFVHDPSPQVPMAPNALRSQDTRRTPPRPAAPPRSTMNTKTRGIFETSIVYDLGHAAPHHEQPAPLCPLGWHPPEHIWFCREFSAWPAQRC